MQDLTNQLDNLATPGTPKKPPANQNVYNLPKPAKQYNPIPIKVPDRFPSEYNFPRHKLKQTLDDPSKLPLVIVSCGSFSPITYLHLRLFEMARDFIVDNTRYEILGGYFSPVSDAYNKIGLAPATHRVTMCELATADSDWLMVDRWEPAQRVYVRTAKVLDHFREELNGREGGFVTEDGRRQEIKILLLAGGDLIESFAVPNLWTSKDLHRILGVFGCIIVERTGSNVSDFLLQHDILHHHRANILVIKQYIFNDISSTKVRLFVKRGMSVRFLLPNPCVDYILTHRLYHDETTPKQHHSSSSVHSAINSLSRNTSLSKAPHSEAKLLSPQVPSSHSPSSSIQMPDGIVSSTPGDMIPVKLATVASPDLNSYSSP